MTVDDPGFMTVAELAAALRVSGMTIYRQVRSGELESVRIGRVIRIPERSWRKLLAR